MAALKLTLLGGFSLTTGTGETLPVPGRKDRLLLCYLALQPSRLPRERLHALLWPDRNDVQARGSLRQSLAALREALEGGTGLLLADRDTVGLQAEDMDVDALAFKRLAALSPNHAESAIALYRGELLAGLDPLTPEFEHWLRLERQRFEMLACRAVETIATAGLGDPAASTAIALGEQLLVQDPLREPLYRALMRLHVARLDRSGALRLFAECRRALKEELDVEPQLETVQLYRDLLGGQSTKTPAAAAEPPLSIVVLPFVTMGDDPGQRYFADALTDDITTDLSRIAGSFVIARSTASTYTDKPTDARTVARELGVRYVLEGSVRRLFGKVRVAVQLISGGTGACLWAERFDYDLVELWRIQEEVTRRIAQALNLQLIDAESHYSLRERPGNPNAVDLAMQAWSLLNRSARKDYMDRAKELFQASLALDERLVSAMVGLANVTMTKVDRGWSDTPADDVKQAETLITDALVRDPKWGAAQRVRSLIFAYRFELPEAIAAAEAAIGLNRNDSLAHRLLALYHLQSGQAERCCELIEQEMRLNPRDPNHWSYHAILARAQIALNRCEEALGNLHRALALNPDVHFVLIWLAAAYGKLGRTTEARQAIAEFLEKNPSLMTGRSAPERTVMQAQLELAALGYYIGIIDGRMGPFGQQALRAFQEDQGTTISGMLDAATLAALLPT